LPGFEKRGCPPRHAMVVEDPAEIFVYLNRSCQVRGANERLLAYSTEANFRLQFCLKHTTTSMASINHAWNAREAGKSQARLRKKREVLQLQQGKALTLGSARFRKRRGEQNVQSPPVKLANMSSGGRQSGDRRIGGEPYHISHNGGEPRM